MKYMQNGVINNLQVLKVGKYIALTIKRELPRPRAVSIYKCLPNMLT